jgi:hypothetical protein
MVHCPECKDQVRPVGAPSAPPKGSGIGISGITWVCPNCEVILGVSEVDFLETARVRDSTVVEGAMDGLGTDMYTPAIRDAAAGATRYDEQGIGSERETDADEDGGE